MTPEYFLIPMLMNNLKGINTGYPIIDTFIIIIITLSLTQNTIKFKDIRRYFNRLFKHPNGNTIIFNNEGHSRSEKFRAIMYYISKINNKSINTLRESPDNGYWDRNDNYITKTNGYEIIQDDYFNITKDIQGLVKEEVKEKSRYNERTDYKDIYILKLFSKTLTVIEMEKWIEERVKEYKKYLISKSLDNQLLLSITYDVSKKDIQLESTIWESSITFENSYFHNKNKILKQIDFFLNNKDFYREKGIPYNLGILLYGEPGCGKTRFIKQLINYTGRHAIDIKLNDSFDFVKLKNVIYKEEIKEDYIIPQDKRIIIFEDIDAVGKTFKDRKLLDKSEKSNVPIPPDFKFDDSDVENVDNNTFKKNKPNNLDSKFMELMKDKNLKNNNLALFLNMIDGINECSGRIIVMTTNRINYLDKAIIRPGRIDLLIECKKCDKDDIYNLIKNFWDIRVKYSSIRDDIIGKYTSAEIINTFRSTDTFSNIKDLYIST